MKSVLTYKQMQMSLQGTLSNNGSNLSCPKPSTFSLGIRVAESILDKGICAYWKDICNILFTRHRYKLRFNSN